MTTLILSRSAMTSLLPMAEVLAAVEGAFRAHGEGRARMPPKVYLPLPEHAGDFRAMPAFLEGAAGVKWVSSHPENPARHGLPAVSGLLILNDPETAAPLAVMDATWLTALRTGAAAAVASKHLAAARPHSLGFVGCGVQARTLLEAHRVIYPGDLELRMADRDAEAAQAFAAQAGGRATSIAEAAACDIVCTSTPARAPVIDADWVSPGAHVNAIGADAAGKQELDPRLLSRCRIVVDDLEQARHSGEINVAMARGDLAPEEIHATLGEVIAGRKPGREADETTLFDSTGLALQDLAVARLAYERARARGVGTEVDF
jgi:ornithine cyclodeaminase/alanine dehydrogenase